ncbi:acetyl-CoA carboxylase carboxyl transferase subunit alpha [Tamaricihabitans halophyticus]|nr:acetyl-CoA carboxylase carboxyl transferase subunit alpha [Tamaricihabitans halophyticus]
MTRPVEVVDELASEQDWLCCAGCRVLIYRKRFDRLAGVCPECGQHTQLVLTQRFEQLLDSGSITAVDTGQTIDDPLRFSDRIAYRNRLTDARHATALSAAVEVVSGTIGGYPVVVAAMDFRFLGGSMGAAEGEAVTRAAEAALRKRVPLLLVTASGGARMQEGAISLMQMAKTSNAMAALDEAGLLTITLVTDPTYGGVAASFATLSDVILAEPGARMGFAGPRVIEQTIRRKLPDGFQTAEFLLRHGLVDDVRPRAELASVLGVLATASAPVPRRWGEAETDPTRYHPDQLAMKSSADVVRLARDLDRPTTLDHLVNWVEGFVELHGDRTGFDCPAVVGGIAILDGLPVVVIGHQKGHDTAELVRRNFGMASPAGYRKAARLMRLAAKLRVPLVTLLDTPGAYPGLDAEEHGQSSAVAECMRIMGGLPSPVVSVITGEGGSGGALALGVANRVLMCENAMYSVISPEGCAAILWKTSEAATAAAEALRVDARSSLELGIVDGVVPEPNSGAHADPAEASELVRRAVVCALRELRTQDGQELVAERRQRFRRFGTEP